MCIILIVMSLRPILQWRHNVFALSTLASVSHGFHPVPSVFLSLHENTEWIPIKFVGSNHYQEIKRLHFGQKWNRDKGAGYNR